MGAEYRTVRGMILFGRDNAMDGMKSMNEFSVEVIFKACLEWEW
jgi:hypothetical protein